MTGRDDMDERSIFSATRQKEIRTRTPREILETVRYRCRDCKHSGQQLIKNCSKCYGRPLHKKGGWEAKDKKVK